MLNNLYNHADNPDKSLRSNTLDKKSVQSSEFSKIGKYLRMAFIKLLLPLSVIAADNDFFNTALAQNSTNQTSLQGNMNARAASNQCSDETGNPIGEKLNKAMTDFVSWMREKGYDESIIAQYIQWWSIGSVKDRSIIKNFLEVKKKPENNLKQDNTVYVYDLIPLDPGTTYLSLDQNTCNTCQPTEKWPGWCDERSPQPADYVFVENHFRHTFGVEFDFVYYPMEISYTDVFGKPDCQPRVYKKSNKDTPRCKFKIDPRLLDQFPPHSIVHFAITSFPTEAGPAQIYNHSVSNGNVALVTRTPESFLTIVTYTHEWGHTLGLRHPFVDVKDINKRIFVQLDGIMSNTYARNTKLIDPTDPLERYILEPKNGYLDEPSFVNEYNKHFDTLSNVDQQ